MADEKPNVTVIIQEPPKPADTFLSTVVQLIVFGLLALAVVWFGR